MDVNTVLDTVQKVAVTVSAIASAAMVVLPVASLFMNKASAAKAKQAVLVGQAVAQSAEAAVKAAQQFLKRHPDLTGQVANEKAKTLAMDSLTSQFPDEDVNRLRDAMEAKVHELKAGTTFTPMVKHG